MVYSEWGQVELKKGEHTLEIEATGPVMSRRPVTQGDQWYFSAAVMEATDHRMQADVLIFTIEPLVPTAELAAFHIHARLDADHIVESQCLAGAGQFRAAETPDLPRDRPGFSSGFFAGRHIYP
ncbi:MAG: hypothetical protein ACUVQG_11470 [Thermogutta sp.]